MITKKIIFCAYFDFEVLNQVLNAPNEAVMYSRFGIDNYFGLSVFKMTSWDENLQLLSNPFRLLYESNGTIFTWLKE